MHLSLADNRRKSQVNNPYYANERRKLSEASLNVINGYAGFINNNKYHRKITSDTSPPASPEKQWGINSWV